MAEVVHHLAIPDRAYVFGDAPETIFLVAFFQANDAAGPLAFAATVLEGGGVEVAVEGDRLSVRPGDAEATALVRIAASGQDGGSAADTFQVVVRDPFSAAVGPDSTLVLPVAEGMRWTYDLRTSTALTGEPPRRSTGQIELEVISAGACREGERVFGLREQRTETVEWQNPNGGEWEVRSGPTATTRSYRWTVSGTTPRTSRAARGPGSSRPRSAARRPGRSQPTNSTRRALPAAPRLSWAVHPSPRPGRAHLLRRRDTLRHPGERVGGLGAGGVAARQGWFGLRDEVSFQVQRSSRAARGPCAGASYPCVRERPSFCASISLPLGPLRARSGVALPRRRWVGV